MPDRKRSFEYLKEESKILDERIKNVTYQFMSQFFLIRWNKRSRQVENPHSSLNRSQKNKSSQ